MVGVLELFPKAGKDLFVFKKTGVAGKIGGFTETEQRSLLYRVL